MADPLPNHLSRPRGPCPRTFRAAPLLLAASLAACSAPHESSLETKTLPAVSCGPYGHILPEALPGESYAATDPLTAMCQQCSTVAQWTFLTKTVGAFCSA